MQTHESSALVCIIEYGVNFVEEVRRKAQTCEPVARRELYMMTLAFHVFRHSPISQDTADFLEGFEPTSLSS